MSEPAAPPRTGECPLRCGYRYPIAACVRLHLIQHPMSNSATAPEQPYGPGAMCDECGHFAGRHSTDGCHFPRPADHPCRCAGMLWLDVRWPRPWLPAPEGLTA